MFNIKCEAVKQNYKEVNKT